MPKTLCAIVTPELSTDDGVVTTTSIQLAEHFGKRHNDVLRAIRNLLADMPTDRQRNFAHTVETRANPSGGAPISSPCYRITRDGFTLLAMGFTGKEALQWKLAYIDAFNRMEAEIHARATALPRKEMTVNEMVDKMTRLLGTGNSYPPILFMPLVNAVMRKQGYTFFLPPQQAQEITERLDRLSMVFHPLSSPASDVFAIGRALRGLNPKSSAEEPGYRQVLPPVAGTAFFRQVETGKLVRA